MIRTDIKDFIKGSLALGVGISLAALPVIAVILGAIYIANSYF